MTHAAILPKRIKSTREATVITAEVPKAYQKRKFELLMTAFRFSVSWEKDAPCIPTGSCTISVCFLKEFTSTR